MADLVFFAVLASTVALVWIFPIFPTQDGPAHLENARLLVAVLRGDPLARQFFSLEAFSPNWVTHVLLAPLLWVVPPTVAEKILLTIPTVLVPLGFRKALRALEGPPMLALLGLPFAHSYLLTMGFTNFCLGTGVGLFVLARWVRGGRRSTLETGIGLAVTYLLHPVAFVVAAGLVIVLAALRGRSFWLPAALAVLPGILLVLFFLRGHESTEVGGGPDRLVLFETLGVLVSYALSEAKLSTMFWWALSAVGLFELARLPWKRSWKDGLAIGFVGLFVLAFTVPFFFAGGAYLPERFLFAGALVVALWVGTRAPGELLPPLLGGMAAFVAVALNVVRAGPIRERNAALAEYTSIAGFLEPNALVLALNGSMAGERHDGETSVTKVDSLRHAVGYLAVDRGVLDLTNYQPDTGHFPLRYRPERNPFGRLFTAGDSELVPPKVDLLRYERETGVAVDDVLLWDLGPERRSDPVVRQLYRGLADGGYEEVARSPGGRMVVYARP